METQKLIVSGVEVTPEIVNIILSNRRTGKTVSIPSTFFVVHPDGRVGLRAYREIKDKLTGKGDRKNFNLAQQYLRSWVDGDAIRTSPTMTKSGGWASDLRASQSWSVGGPLASMQLSVRNQRDETLRTMTVEQAVTDEFRFSALDLRFIQTLAPALKGDRKREIASVDFKSYRTALQREAGSNPLASLIDWSSDFGHRYLDAKLSESLAKSAGDVERMKTEFELRSIEEARQAAERHEAALRNRQAAENAERERADAMKRAVEATANHDRLGAIEAMIDVGIADGTPLNIPTPEKPVKRGRKATVTA